MERSEGIILEMRPISSKGGTRFICQEDLSAARFGNLRRQVIAVLAALLVLASGVGLRMRSSAPWHKTYTRGELVWLAHFSHSMQGLEKQLSASSVSYRFAVRRAVARNDVIALFDAANGYDASLKSIKAEVQKISAAKLADKPNADAMRALFLFRWRLEQLQGAAQTMVSAVDRGRFDDKAFRYMQNADQASDKAALAESAAIERVLAIYRASGERAP